MESAFEEDVHIPLPGITDPHTFENWIKCVMGMNITRKALRKPIELGAKQHLIKMPKEEIYHFEIFSDCLKKENVFHLSGSPKDKSHKNIIWTCRHELCWKILNTLLDFHAQHEKLKRKWVIPMIPQPIASTTKVPSEEGKNVDVICDEYFWDIMKLYTYNETVKGSANSDEIDKIELVLLLQILSNCTFPLLNEFKEEHEKEMAKARNDVMHSGDSSFSDSDLATLFRRMIVTLSIYSDKLKYCNKAIDILADLEKRELFKLARKQNELTLVISKALKSRIEAVEFDMDTCVDQQELNRLRKLYRESKNQYQQFNTTDKASSDEMEKLLRELQESKNQVIELSGQLLESESKVIEQSGQLLESESKVLELLRQLRASEYKVIELSGQLRASESKVDGLSRQVGGLSGQVYSLSSELRNSKDEVRSLKAKLEEHERQMGGLQAAGKSLDHWFWSKKN